jgi:hypothetical protein
MSKLFEKILDSEDFSKRKWYHGSMELFDRFEKDYKVSGPAHSQSTGSGLIFLSPDAEFAATFGLFLYEVKVDSKSPHTKWFKKTTESSNLHTYTSSFNGEYDAILYKNITDSSYCSKLGDVDSESPQLVIIDPLVLTIETVEFDPYKFHEEDYEMSSYFSEGFGFSREDKMIWRKIGKGSEPWKFRL